MKCVSSHNPIFDAATLTGPTGHPREERSWVAGGKWGLSLGGLGVSPMNVRLPGAEAPPEGKFKEAEAAYCDLSRCAGPFRAFRAHSLLGACLRMTILKYGPFTSICTAGRSGRCW